ncbi:hypothetical protein [Dongia deserti]|uniref:hypothetical protein n=1 Tax=Dongia deserti TaxID=2268030 RepID=UPI0013C50818|nr:hypothetical protein [Dongia deserti]
MWKHTHQAKLPGASALVLLIGFVLPFDADAVGFHDFHPDDLPLMMIPVDDVGGADSGSENGGEAGSKDAGSESDSTTADDPADSDGMSSSVEGSGETSSTDNSGLDTDSAVDASPDVQGDTSTSTDVSTGDAGGSAGSSEFDQVDRATADSELSTSTAEGTSVDATSVDGSPAGAPPLGAGAPAASSTSVEIGESLSSPAQSTSGRKGGIVVIEPTITCLVGDPNCLSADRSPALAPSQLQDSNRGVTGVWPPPAPAVTRPSAKQSVRALGLSLVDPIKARDGLVVQGIIVNGSGRSQIVPPVQISVENKAGQILQRWNMRPPISQLPAGQHKAFKVVLQSLPPTVSRVNAAFLAASR